jgi:hypothetical protein
MNAFKAGLRKVVTVCITSSVVLAIDGGALD